MNSTTSSSTHSTWLTRANWVRFNRILAWAMLVTPVAQFFIRAELGLALLVDFGLLLAHGILSLILFGMPKVKKQKFTFSMHVMGFRQYPLSPRHNFLMTGYRLALGLLALFLLFIPDVRWLALLLFYPLLRLPFSFAQHLKEAVSYALQRWGINSLYAGLIVGIYYFFFFSSLLRTRH
ncbi:hypothetical protein ACO0LF_24785 [Undibacterium sp. Di27W]|uniref:hypothetical protein n=1 Tax=Undibacterium sp. Di27W TaxID=3413036 RepID=UPI003BF2146D